MRWALDLRCGCGSLIGPEQMYCERCEAEITRRRAAMLERDESADAIADARGESEAA